MIVNITAPATGVTGVPMAVFAQAMEPVTRLLIEANGVLIGIIETGGLVATWTPTSPGTYALVATATGVDGSISTGSTTCVVAQGADTTPVLPEGSYQAGGVGWNDRRVLMPNEGIETTGTLGSYGITLRTSDAHEVRVSGAALTVLKNSAVIGSAVLGATDIVRVEWTGSAINVKRNGAVIVTVPGVTTAPQAEIVASREFVAKIFVAPPPPPPPVFTPIRVNAGGPAYTDVAGNVWAADNGFSGGTKDAGSASGVIAGTSDPALYRSERWGAMTYTANVPNGSHEVTLKFAEVYFKAAGKRKFGVTINGVSVLSNFDIYAEAGGASKAIDKVFTVTVTTGKIVVQFTKGSADDPKVSAIQVK